MKFPSTHYPQHLVTEVASMLLMRNKQYLSAASLNRSYGEKIKANLRSFPTCNRLPREDKRSQERSDEDADDDVPVVVHGKQHDKIRNRELSHMEHGPDKLLEQVRPDRTVIDTSSGGDICVRALVRG